MTTLSQWLQEGPYTLVMSSGYFSFFAHTGVLACLEEHDLLPAKVSGASAGAMVSAAFAAGLSSDALKDYFYDLKKADFWDPGIGLGLLRGQRFRSKLRELLPVARLEECRLSASISLFNVLKRRTDVYQSGPLADIIYGSCAVPIMFQPIVIEGQLYLDGGIKDRPGLMGVADDERVLYHHILPRPFRENTVYARYDLNAGLRIRPIRANMVTLIMHSLPLVGPDVLERGRDAFSWAHTALSQSLHTQMDSSLLMLDAQ